MTLVKARGAWTLFDDDTVSTVKESDIPKYFGDSNSGSAYVLYYQAVDLDLPALGLKSPTPPLEPTTTADIGFVPLPVGLATAEPSELSHAPSSPFLHKPPGLNPSVDDLNLSDMSESPMLTPGTAPPTSSNHNTSDSLPVFAPAPSYPHLHNIPDEPLIPIPSPSSPTHKEHGSSTLGKALRTLRHPPSLRLKTPNGHKDDHRRSGAVDAHGAVVPAPPLPASPRTRRPQTTGSTATASTAEISTHETIPSVPPSPVPPKAFSFPNGSSAKDKERAPAPEKKSNGWFRRKSTRQETGASPPTPGSSSPSFPRLARRGSEAAMSDAYSPVVPPTPLPTLLPPPLASAAHTEPPLSSSSSPHKKSVPDLARSLRREKRGSSNSSAKLPPRPATAGAEMTSSSSSRGFDVRPLSGAPPLPPLPGSPQVPGAHRAHAAEVFAPLKGTDAANGSPRRPSRGPLPDEDPAEREPQPQLQPAPAPAPAPAPPLVRMSHSDSQYSSTTHQSHHTHMHWTLPRPPGHAHAETAPPPPPPPVLSFGGTGGGGVGDTPVVVSPTAPDGGGAGHNWRRATRKLSFTAPILGFGRKERERERERERKGPPPSSSAAYAR